MYDVDLDDLLSGGSTAGPAEGDYASVPWYGDLLACTACPIRREASRVVPGAGPRDARIAFLGRNPGRDEDLFGAPFIGPAGQVLDEFLAVLGIDRQKILVLNLVKCYTAEDRKPTAREIQACTSRWLQEEFRTFTNVEVLVTLGDEASRFVLGPRSPGMAKLSFVVWRVSLDETPTRVLQVIPMAHPSYLLHKPSARPGMLALLQSTAEYLRQHTAGAYEASR